MTTIWDFRNANSLYAPVRAYYRSPNGSVVLSSKVYETTDLPLSSCILLLSERMSSHRDAVRNWFRVRYAIPYIGRIQPTRFFDTVRTDIIGTIATFTDVYTYATVPRPDISNFVWFELESDAVAYSMRRPTE